MLINKAEFSVVQKYKNNNNKMPETLYWPPLDLKNRYNFQKHLISPYQFEFHIGHTVYGNISVKFSQNHDSHSLESEKQTKETSKNNK